MKNKNPLSPKEELSALKAIYKERAEYYLRNQIDIDYYTMLQITKAGNPEILKAATAHLRERKMTQERIVDTLKRLKKMMLEVSEAKSN